MASYQYGDKVVFTDEFGKERVGTVIAPDAYDMPGRIGIDVGEYGMYHRASEDIRPAQDYEVHKSDIEQLNK